MPTRRSTVIGLGALTAGSGAAFTSASFSSSVDSNADMRVIVDQELRVQKGSSFKDMSDPSNGDTTQITTGTPLVTYITVEGDGSQVTEALFDDTEDVSRPAVAANRDDNSSFAFAVSVDVDESDLSIDDLIEVNNEGETEEAVGVQFLTPGEDTTNGSGSVSTSDIANGVFTFDHSSEGTISSDEFEGEEDDTPNNFVDISAGEEEQIDLIADPDNNGRGDIVSEVAGNPFDDSGALGVVDLVDEIRIGTELQ